MPDTDLSRRLDRLGKVVTADQQLSRGERKRLKRERKRERELTEASVVGGSIMVLVAAALVAVAVMDPGKWWLLFIALSFGVGGGKQIEIARRRDRQGLPADPVSAPTPAKVDRFEQACDQLLAELKDSPSAVRDFLGKPEATVEAIRAACRQLKQRQAMMLDAVSAERAAELQQERKDLEARLGHLDESTYRRATEALRLRTELFNQVRSSAERLASEQQILLTSLESLRMRVALAKGAGGQGASLGDMKAEVDRLSEELSAITDALEGVQKSELQAVAPIAPPDSGGHPEGRREKS